jgi:hypothetical protein
MEVCHPPHLTASFGSFPAEQATFRPPKLPDAEVIEEFARQMTKHGIDANCLLPHGNYLGTWPRPVLLRTFILLSTRLAVNLCNGAEGEGELLGA